MLVIKDLDAASQLDRNQLRKYFGGTFRRVSSFIRFYKVVTDRRTGGGPRYRTRYFNRYTRWLNTRTGRYMTTVAYSGYVRTLISYS